MTSAEYLVLGLNAGAGFELTDRLSAGATITLGTGFEQLGLVPNSAMVHDYALRGTFGIDYALNPCNTLGFFYQTKESFQFPNAVLINNTYRDIDLEQPETLGLGFANRSLMGGDLLLAADIYYKLWEDAAGYSDIFVNQWAFAFGAQLTRGKMKYRAGYSYNTNPVNHNVGSTFSGLPVLQDRIYLLQASETATINQHRLTGGIGARTFCFAASSRPVCRRPLQSIATTSAPILRHRLRPTISALASLGGMVLRYAANATTPVPSREVNDETREPIANAFCLRPLC